MGLWRPNNGPTSAKFSQDKPTVNLETSKVFRQKVMPEGRVGKAGKTNPIREIRGSAS